MTNAEDRSEAASQALADLICTLLGPGAAGPPPDRRTLRKARRDAALAAARASGCTCHPAITFTHPVDGIPNVRVAHDDWCPMLNRGIQFLAFNNPTGHPRTR